MKDLLPPDPVPELLRLTVPHEDVAGVLAARPRPGTEAWRLLESNVHTLVSAMGDLDDPPRFPDLPDPYFYVHVFMAAAPHVREYHRSRGIPDDVSSRTLADLGRNMAVYRKRLGTGGLNAPFWLMLHFRGMIYELGRLQFERATLDERLAESIKAAGLPCEPGEPALSVHIPDFLGPMTPEACDAAFAEAAAFFPRHFPEERPRYAFCGSWLLDEQLARYLPEESNIVRFQRRFRPAYRSDNDGGIVPFVFGADARLAPDLPRRTNLERAVGDHLRAGNTWHATTGWTPLAGAPAE